MRIYTSYAAFKKTKLEEIINDLRIRIVGYSTEKNWFGQLPSKDWLCILVVNEKPRRYIDEVISKI